MKEQNSSIQSTVEPHPARISPNLNSNQDAAQLSYPMVMPSAEDSRTEQSSNVSPVTDNGEFEPIQTDAEMSLYKNTGEPGPNNELPSDTIS